MEGRNVIAPIMAAIVMAANLEVGPDKRKTPSGKGGNLEGSGSVWVCL
jgi:hypothetical protein